MTKKEGIRNWIQEYEELADAGSAMGDRAIVAFIKINAWFKKAGYEYCSHNLAIMGSTRYAHLKEKDNDSLITKSQWQSRTKEVTND